MQLTDSVDTVIAIEGVTTWRVYEVEWTTASGMKVTGRHFRSVSRGDIRRVRSEYRATLLPSAQASLKVTYLGRHSYTDVELAA